MSNVTTQCLNLYLILKMVQCVATGRSFQNLFISHCLLGLGLIYEEYLSLLHYFSLHADRFLLFLLKMSFLYFYLWTLVLSSFPTAESRTVTSTITSTIIATATATGASSGPSSSSFASDTEFRSSILNSTNFYRAQHNATALTWNQSLATYAATYAEKCLWKHSVPLPFPHLSLLSLPSFLSLSNTPRGSTAPQAKT